MTHPPLILASNSPRRRRLLALGGWPFEIVAVEIDENPYQGEEADRYVLRMAETKARAALPLVSGHAVILAADTAVVDRTAGPDNTPLGLEIIGKPAGQAEAASMLRQLRGHAHQVYTAVAVMRAAPQSLISALCTTEVMMRAYQDEEIEDYVNTGDPLDKAGAYAIQHAQFQPVESLRGCYANVVGLPLCLVSRLLKESGIQPASHISRSYVSNFDQPCLVTSEALPDHG